MKKIIAVVLVLIFTLSPIGCKKKGEEVFSFAPITLRYTGGNDDWCTTITLNPDGSFEGSFTDTAETEKDSKYPSGTVYYSDFKGQFTEIELISTTHYSMKIEELDLKVKDGKEKIEDGVRYIAFNPLGLSENTEYELYTPDTPVGILPELFLFWWPQAALAPETLSCYALRNTLTDEGFFSNTIN